MSPATRTPEGDSGRCPVCGNEVTLEPSIPPGDAPCPNCGCLIWFELGKAKPVVSRELLATTRHQISAIVREIAALSNCDLAPCDFYERFLTRTVQALAAVGGAVWLLEDRKRWPMHWFQRQRLQVTCKLNVASQLLALDSPAFKRHHCLLEHVLATNEEQLVPPLSAVKDAGMSGNPTRELLILSPLRKRNRIAGIVEIFQRPNTANATQRGYLQFLKQMCELGSSYLDHQAAA